MTHARLPFRTLTLLAMIAALPLLADAPSPGKKKIKQRGNTGVRQLEIRLASGGVKQRGTGPEVQAQSSDSKTEAPHGRNLSSDDLVIKVIDEKGRVIDKYYRKDPRLIRAEGFLNKDKAGPGRKIQAGGDLFLDVPNRADAAALEIYKAAWNGKTYALKFEQRVQIPKADSAPGLKKRGGGATMKTILDNGNPEAKVDIVIGGDGYTAAQMGKWKDDAARLTTALLKEKPFSEYPKAFNIHRIDIASDEEGAGWIGPESKRNAFGSHFNCYSTERLLCVDTGETNRIFHSVLSENQMDIKIVISNDKRYGGAGGEVATASLHEQSLEILIHEIAHSFGGLADEYAGGERDCNYNTEPAEPNVTVERNAGKAKWAGVPGTGHFEGGRYCDRGFFRPYEDSKMRSLGKPFGELHLRIMRQRIESITGAAPSDAGRDDKKEDPEEKREEPARQDEPKDQKKPGTIREGQLVLVKWQDGYKYAARVVKPAQAGLTVRWADGDEDFDVARRDAKPFSWKAGMTAECIWESNGELYAGRFVKVSEQKVAIQWDDGTGPDEVSVGACRAR